MSFVLWKNITQLKNNGFTPVVVNLTDGVSANDLWVHDERDRVKAGILSRFFDNPKKENHLPRPFGLFYVEDRYCYEDKMTQQITDSQSKKGAGDLDVLLRGKETWTIN